MINLMRFIRYFNEICNNHITMRNIVEFMYYDFYIKLLLSHEYLIFISG